MQFRNEVRHEVTVNFEPRPIEDVYVKGPKLAHMIVIDWRWNGECWVNNGGDVFFRRVKKDGSLYSEQQRAYLYGKNRDEEFAPEIEASRPRYTPTLVA